MHTDVRRAALCGACVAALLVAPAADARAQELEPGAYVFAPVKINIFIVANTINTGDLAFDPSGPFEDASATLNFTVLGYGHSFDLAGRSANVSIGVPIVAGHLEARYLGGTVEADRFGMGDPRVRVAVNLYGAPAMDLATFVKTPRPRRSLGASLTVGVPLGQYSEERLVNVGSNRWAFKPELGLVNTVGAWTLESYAGVWLFTDNVDFFSGTVREQDPIGSVQFHLHYTVSPRWTLSGNTNFYFGGRTIVNGTENLDLQRNSRVGVTVVRPFSGGRTLRVAVSRGAYTTIGADFTALSVAFQKTWGGR